MSSLKSFNLLFLVLIFLFIALTKSTPIKDITSSVNSKEISLQNLHIDEVFVIPFEPVEALNNEVSDYDILAQSTFAIIINLKIENDILNINGLPLSLGSTSVQVIEAKVVPVNISKEEIEYYNDNNDIALITVKISSMIDSTLVDDENLVINNVKISTTVMEVDGIPIVKVEAIEKILEIEEISEPSSSFHHHLHKPCKNFFAQLKSRAFHLWSCSRYTKMILTSLLFTSILSTFLIIYYLISIHFSTTTDSYQPIPNSFNNDDKNGNESFEKVIFITDEEKRALMEEYQ